MHYPIKIVIRKRLSVRVRVRVRVRFRVRVSGKVNQKRQSFIFKNDSCTL